MLEMAGEAGDHVWKGALIGASAEKGKGLGDLRPVGIAPEG
jgi:hypothetical protein